MKFLPLLFVLIVAGCSTVQTVATRHIDEIIESKVLDKTDPIGFSERQTYKKVLLEAKDEIITSRKAQETAEVKAEKNARLAGQARIFWIITYVGGVLAVIAIIMSAVMAVRKFVFRI